MNPEIQKAFHEAVSSNDIETARRMIAAGADVNAPYDEYENRSFLDACYSGNLAMVKMLVEAGADVNLPNSNGVATLFKAIVSPYDTTQLIKYLIKQGADVNGNNRAVWSPLQAAVAQDASDIVKMLLAAGANPNIHSEGNDSVLFMAADNGSADIVDMLLKAGANPNYLPEVRSYTPLAAACCWGHDEAAELLIKADANPHVYDSKWGDSILMEAVHGGNSRCVGMLLALGVEVNKQNVEGDTAIAYAVNRPNPHILLMLLKAGADPNIANNEGVTPLAAALSYQDYECAEILMRFGARLPRQGDYYSEEVLENISDMAILNSLRANNMPLRTDDEAIVYLAKFSHFNLLRRTLELGGNPNARDSAGKSAFEWAWDNHRHAPHCAACLIKHGALYRQSLFLQAVYERKREIITAMLSTGVDVNTTDPRGDTALHYAVRSNSVAIMRELIEGGCDIEARNHDNLTPLMLAICKRRCEAASVLMQAGADAHASGGELNEGIVEMCSRYLTEIDGNVLRKVDWRTGISRGWQFAGLQSKHLSKLLMDCCWNADIDMAKELIKAGANPDYQDGRGYTPLMLASAGGSLELVQYLLDQGADINACEYEKGWDALCLAGWNNRTEIYQFLSNKRHDK